MFTNSGYRDTFNNVLVLHKLKNIIFGLSGSILSLLYPDLCKLMRMNWKVLRTSSSRKEVKYQAVSMKTDADMNPTIVDYLKTVTVSYYPKDHAMVFCCSKQEARDLADVLDTLAFYAVTIEEEERNTDIVNEWLAGGMIIIVSTSILGCRFDFTMLFIVSLLILYWINIKRTLGVEEMGWSVM
jgi:hypothetical protein